MDTTIPYTLKNKIRFVTATALFDGHDASINIMRRLLQQGGAEVIHLGHNRSVQEIVRAVLQEDAQAVAVSSYQGGHVEFFRYMRECLNAAGRSDVRIFGGGGGVIIPSEIEDLHRSGVTRIYSPDDGRKLGLTGMIADMLERSDYSFSAWNPDFKETEIRAEETLRLARALTLLENEARVLPAKVQQQIVAGRLKGSLESDGANHKAHHPLVLGVTGTGGAGKSSLTDEIIRRFTLDFPERKICIFSVDPSKKKTGGALLGDRIRMNAINHQNVFMRSFATRGSKSELAAVMQDAIALARSSGFDLVIVETSGIGQGDTGILGVSNLAMYVMTSEYGAATQLEKIDMLDFADLIAINKFDRRGSEDAYRDVKAQLRRSRFQGRHISEDSFPLFGTIASKFNDDGVNALYGALVETLNQRCGAKQWVPHLNLPAAQKSTQVAPIIPQNRTNYLSEIAATVRAYHQETETVAELARDVQALERSAKILPPSPQNQKAIDDRKGALSEDYRNTLAGWDALCANYRGDKYKYEVRGKLFEVPTTNVSLSGTKISRVALPQTRDWGEIVRFSRSE
ncbi:MAG: hypothetical protein RL189_357, partial [Pseudomonadota bacterium]